MQMKTLPEKTLKKYKLPNYSTLNVCLSKTSSSVRSFSKNHFDRQPRGEKTLVKFHS